jgi:uncharacterized protein (UPF0333 family)
MGNTKNIIIVVLVIIIFVMGYMLMVSFPKKAKAECEANIGAVVQAQVTNAVQQCQQTLQQLMQIPACASALSQ